MTAEFEKPEKSSSSGINPRSPTEIRTSKATTSTRSFSVAKRTRAARMISRVRAMSAVIVL